ncbi:hypothetical protein J7T55_000995 [Diaporthe amygdali]|uniref:uncharacterized protein n=1 Tax=Phomopsis amygdali TaxID=1214568 RepID=UPI0022FDC9D1|nr:uncharacterized protein J7T55_000995 [Diaporthe amygdali]KAJ0120140.1 hypothetical protein J7T55_000995 [Diaporthe amygdali]
MILQICQMNASPGQFRMRHLGQMPAKPPESDFNLHLGPRVSTERFSLRGSPGQVQAQLMDFWDALETRPALKCH